MDNIIEVINLNKNYERFMLKDITFSLPDGCIAGLIGVNGAGKTTIIKCILNLIKKDGGEIRLFNVNNNKFFENDRIGVVFDGDCFYEHLTLKEMKNIVSGGYHKWDDKVFHKYMKLFNLDIDMKIDRLSKGMKMRYSLALALSHNAEILIMDEPTGGLDPLVRKEFLDIIGKFMEDGGRGAIISTHNIQDLEKIADKIVMLDNGKLIFEEEKDNLLESYRIVKFDKKILNKEIKELFIDVKDTQFGCKGITNKSISEIRTLIEDVIIEPASLEEIMIANIKSKRISYDF